MTKGPTAAQRAKHKRKFQRLTISNRQALLRLNVMVRSVVDDVKIVLGAEAVLEEGNALVRTNASNLTCKIHGGWRMWCKPLK